MTTSHGVIETPIFGFTSIPRSVYWAIVTVTTVGYGDITPQTVAGQFIASMAMLTGYAILAVPTGILSAELITEIQRDRDAFAALFDHFAPRLKGFIIRSGASAHQAEEIVQDVMLTIWRKAATFDPHRAQVSAWIYQIARNRQIDIARKESRPMPEELREEPGSEPDASQILALEQEAGQLKQALTKLNPEQREIIEKAYLGDLTHKEISAQTGLPLGTIKSRIRLGLERLRHELKDLAQ